MDPKIKAQALKRRGFINFVSTLYPCLESGMVIITPNKVTCSRNNLPSCRRSLKNLQPYLSKSQTPNPTF